MVVTCPNCSKRYMLDEALLPKEGRKVRCISCHHVWSQIPDASSFPSTPHLLEFTETVGAPHFSSKKAFSWTGGVISFAILLSLLSCFVFGRKIVATLWPHSEKFYDLVGLHVDMPGSSLALSNIQSRVHREDTLEMVMVSGDVINTSNRVRSIPPLKISFIGEPSHSKCRNNSKGKDCVLDYYEHRLSETSLLPGEQIHFETAPRPKTEGTHHISIEF